MINLLSKSKLTFFALVLLTVFSCKSDDDISSSDDLVASFQFAINDSNPFEVTFSNFSDNATSYSWDFGDTNTSTDESPTHTYATGGTYTVVLTASDGADNATFSRDITITDPSVANFLLTGNVSKDWYLQREGIAMGIGPAINDNAYWSFGGVTPLGDRPCILDDVYTFNADGTFSFSSNGTLFIDSEANGGWLGPAGAEGCYEEDATSLTAATGEDVSAFGDGGDYTYDYNTASNTITINGAGAYIGLAPKTSEGDNYVPISTKTYEIISFTEGTIADSLKMAIVGADFAWNFYLVSYKDINDLPAIPSSMPAANFTYEKTGFDVTFTNTSANATSYSWDFGDGMTSGDENPSHTYSSEGAYTVTLTAMDGMGGSDEKMEEILISTATFDAAVLSSAAGKVWKLDGEASYYVGPTAGSNEWWPGIDAAGVTERACQLDDEFIFFDDGTMEYDTKGEVWAEAYMGGSNACMADGDIPSPYDVFGSGTHAFTADATTITTNGQGAFIGFNRANNAAEISDTNPPGNTITYDVLDYSVAGNKETITITVNYQVGFWTMRLFSEN